MIHFSSNDINSAIRNVSRFLECYYEALSQTQSSPLKVVSKYYSHKREMYAQWSTTDHEPFFLSTVCTQLSQLLEDYRKCEDKSGLQGVKTPDDALKVLEKAHMYFYERLQYREQMERNASHSLKRNKPITSKYSFKKPRDGHHSKAYLRGVNHAKTLLGALRGCDRLDALLSSPNATIRFQRQLKRESTFTEFVTGGMEVFNKRLSSFKASKAPKI